MSVSVAPCELAVTYVKCCPGDEALTGAPGASQLLTEQPRCLHRVSMWGAGQSWAMLPGWELEEGPAGRCCLGSA